MKTVFHTNVNGFEIINGFGDAHPDPVATFAKIGPALQALPEQAAVDEVYARVNVRRQKLGDDFAVMFGRPFDNKPKTQAEADWIATESAIVARDCDIIASRMPELVADLEAARTALFDSAAVFFQPGPGEDLIGAEDYARLSKLVASAENAKVTLTGEVVPDFRGTVFWTASPWKKFEIDQLGETVPAGGILESALTIAQWTEITNQQEATRIAGMTADQKAAELKTQLDALASQALAQKQKAEITGAEFDPKAWYAEQAAVIQKKYQ